MEWRDIPGYEGLYLVSTDGRVRSLRSGKVLANLRLAKPKFKDNPYHLVPLYDAEGQKKQMLVHRAVALAFLPNPEDKPTVNHKDGIRSNNHKSNLEWATYSENHRHAYESLGRKPHLATLRDSSRPCACFKNGTLVGEYPSGAAAARALGLRQTSINRAAIGQRKSYAGFSWKYLDQ